MKNVILNVVANETAWFATAYGASNGIPAVGIAACAAAIGLGLVISNDRRALAFLAAALGIFGFGAENLMLCSGSIAYSSPGAWSVTAPQWILALWMAFATVVHTSFNWLERRPILSAILGATMAPLSYMAAERMGALRLLDPSWHGLLAIAGLWSIAMPGAIALNAKLSGRSSRGYFADRDAAK